MKTGLPRRVCCYASSGAPLIAPRCPFSFGSRLWGEPSGVGCDAELDTWFALTPPDKPNRLGRSLPAGPDLDAWPTASPANTNWSTT